MADLCLVCPQHLGRFRSYWCWGPTWELYNTHYDPKTIKHERPWTSSNKPSMRHYIAMLTPNRSKQIQLRHVKHQNDWIFRSPVISKSFGAWDPQRIPSFANDSSFPAENETCWLIRSDPQSISVFTDNFDSLKPHLPCKNCYMGKYGCFYIQFHPDYIPIISRHKSHCWKVIVFPSLSENRIPPNPLVNHKCPYQKPINWGIAHFQTQPNITYCWLCLPRNIPIQKIPRHFIIASFQKAGKPVIPSGHLT